MTFACAVAAGWLLVSAGPAEAAWDKPWTAEDRALVVDAYEFNPIDWKALTSDPRIAGFINKASDGLPPEWNCKGKSGDEELLCKNRWWKYSVTKELYMTRREMAKTLGLKWGAYHLGRPGNPREQADHFIDFAEPAADELIALDIEDNTAEWMSLADAEIFANQIFIRTGRYPVLYTNGSTAKWISDYKDTYRVLSRLPLWYARYRDDITGVFPETTWPAYALWQFSSMHNCSERKCPYRVKGAKTDIDVNVSPLDVAGLRAAWPFAELVKPLDEDLAEPTLVARAGEEATTALASLGSGLRSLIDADPDGEAAAAPVDPAPSETAHRVAAALTPKASLVAAYAPAEGHPHLDPLKLLTEAALQEHRKGTRLPVAAAIGARARPQAAVAAHPARVASLGSMAAMKDEMAAVAAIAAPTARPHPASPAAALPTRTAKAAERSRFRQWMAAAEAEEGETGLGMPAYVLSQTAAHDRGRVQRPSALLRKVSMPAVGGPVELRIASAFRATR